MQLLRTVGHFRYDFCFYYLVFEQKVLHKGNKRCDDNIEWDVLHETMLECFSKIRTILNRVCGKSYGDVQIKVPVFEREARVKYFVTFDDISE